MELRVELNHLRVQEAFARAPARMTAAVEAALARGADELAVAAKRRAPKAFSTLTNSIRALRAGELHYQVAAGAHYARMVEEGRPPGRQAGTQNGLVSWVRQKTGLTGTELDRRTFLVARAIGRRGLRPQPYMQPALDEVENRLRAMAKGAAARAAEEVLGG